MLFRSREVTAARGDGAFPGEGEYIFRHALLREGAYEMLTKDDRVLGFIASTGDRDLMRVETSRGGEQTISTTKYEVTGRGGKGRELLQRGQFTRIIPNEIENPTPLAGNV